MGSHQMKERSINFAYISRYIESNRKGSQVLKSAFL